jgi:hypothetical protein
MKPVVLMVTPTLGEKAACGVGLYGRHWATALADLPEHQFNVLYTDSIEETINEIRRLSPSIVFYHWNRIASGWMEHPIFREMFPNIKHVNICVDTVTKQEEVDNFSPEVHNGGFQYLLVNNPMLVGNKNVFVSNKLLPPGPTIPEYTGDLPIIGYHGFAMAYKGIARLASVVNAEFTECIFRLHMPQSWFMDHHGQEIQRRKFEIQQIITKPGIKVEYSHHMMEPQEVVNWLSQNSINCYFYDRMDHAALASATDYALAARKPIAVSRSNYFKDFFACDPSVVINEPYSLKQIMQHGIEPIKHLHQKYSKENFIRNWTDGINHFLSL